jgi:hypothetical protein
LNRSVIILPTMALETNDDDFLLAETVYNLTTQPANETGDISDADG